MEQAQWPAFGKLAEQKGIAAQVPLLMPNTLTAETRAADMPLVDFGGGIIKRASVKGAVGGGHTLAMRPGSRSTEIGVPALIVEGMDDPLYPIEKPAAVDHAILSWARTVK